MIIGLTGSMGCGKGEIVRLFEEKGFKHITLSSMLREEAKNRNLEETRENLMEIGNELRGKNGAGVLAKLSLEKILKSGHGNWIVDGIRNPAEIDELKEGPNVHIVGVVTDRSILVERILSRARSGDATSRDEIVAKIEREWGKDEPPEGQQVGKCMEKIDAAIRNERTMKELEENVDKLYDVLKKEE